MPRRSINMIGYLNEIGNKVRDRFKDCDMSAVTMDEIMELRMEIQENFSTDDYAREFHETDAAIMAGVFIKTTGRGIPLTPPDFDFADSAERPVILLKWVVASLQRDVSEKDIGTVFWNCVLEHWAGFDNLDHEAFSVCFCRFKDYRPETADVPGKPLVVYRGQDETTEFGVSWTADISVAARFAQGHRGMKNPNPLVYRFTVDPSQVAFTTDMRSEKEVVLLAPPHSSGNIDVDILDVNHLNKPVTIS